MLLANLLVLATAAVGAVAQYDDVLYDYDEAQSIPRPAAYETLVEYFKSIRVNTGYGCLLYTGPGCTGKVLPPLKPDCHDLSPYARSVKCFPEN
ncbi:hypothetical protein X797_011460 [Metarhizium robertsii]|uniref:Uncharacterized protein n=1 Tax=Metarhizium robertsii TaxID=568076 RepID=A0A014MW38_9HYPO|nr:hypothetical protein X797_011460 [Metarhizium robertsii]